MDNEIVKLIISPSATLLGVIIGFMLNFMRESYKENSTRREERQSVRTLIRLEIQQNIDELQIFWDRLKKLDKNITDPKRQISASVIKLSQSPIPSWSYKAWESQMSKLPTVFQSEEIVQIQSNYKRLNQISNLLDLLPNRKIAIGTTIATTYLVGEVMPIWNYDNESSFWKDFEDLVLCALNSGNPIEEE
ncbi:hypothetical protein [Chamaesiphon sp. VAR_48_metabat_135_sub]|uniref:hypothetical protein n=1 Tax=Chamaesiphon sp. VAR_48_metabat_135_sub TaxID=2964699 RepID=UPI00286B7C57|nr:hypothetical protein [Chamaesiphon sp. VAR_48_metabat_135_sub]